MYRLASLMLAVSLLAGCGPSKAELERQRQAEWKRQQDLKAQQLSQAVLMDLFYAAQQEELRRMQQRQQPTPSFGGFVTCKECGAPMPPGGNLMRICPGCIRAQKYSPSY